MCGAAPDTDAGAEADAEAAQDVLDAEKCDEGDGD